MRERLIELIKSRTCRNNFCQPNCTNCENVPLQDEEVERLADYLLDKGVIVAPMPMTEELREELAEYVHQRCVDEL